MRNTIPAGTWIFRSRIGTYNFLYPAPEGERTEVDLEVTTEMAWPGMAREDRGRPRGRIDPALAADGWAHRLSARRQLDRLVRARERAGRLNRGMMGA